MQAISLNGNELIKSASKVSRIIFFRQEKNNKEWNMRKMNPIRYASLHDRLKDPHTLSSSQMPQVFWPRQELYLAHNGNHKIVPLLSKFFPWHIFPLDDLQQP
jgi:hypothetical protein